MFDSIGWAEILVLVLAGLFILGPERLPSAAARVGRIVRQVREYATGARDQLRSELGPEFDDLRKPIEELRSVRNLDPRRAVTQHLFDGDDPFEGITSDRGSQAVRGNGHKPKSDALPYRPVDPPLTATEQPPFDADAT